MIEFTIHQLFPDFILADKNGYAMAKAVERALQIMCSTIQTGVDNLQDIDKMAEWRLDEMAWETNCLYDYNSNPESKRYWVKEAKQCDQRLGTIAAIIQYLKGCFSNVQIEEWWQYGGTPYHFRVWCTGDMTSEIETWARRAIARAQNVRSVLDGLTIFKENDIVLAVQRPIAVAMPALMCSDNLLCGEE